MFGKVAYLDGGKCTDRYPGGKISGQTRTRRASISVARRALRYHLSYHYCSLVYALRFRITSDSAVLVTRLVIPVYS